MPLASKVQFMDEVVQELFHEIAQPLSALQCSLDVTLHQPRPRERYLQTLEEAQELANVLRARLDHFREPLFP